MHACDGFRAAREMCSPLLKKIFFPAAATERTGAIARDGLLLAVALFMGTPSCPKVGGVWSRLVVFFLVAPSSHLRFCFHPTLMQDEALQVSCALTLARCLEYTQDVEVQIKAAQVAGRMCAGAKESPSATRFLYEVRHFGAVGAGHRQGGWWGEVQHHYWIFIEGPPWAHFNNRCSRIRLTIALVHCNRSDGP